MTDSAQPLSDRYNWPPTPITHDEALRLAEQAHTAVRQGLDSRWLDRGKTFQLAQEDLERLIYVLRRLPREMGLVETDERQADA